jgi:hypothetical protein
MSTLRRARRSLCFAAVVSALIGAPGASSAQNPRAAVLAAFEGEIAASPKRSATTTRLGDVEVEQELEVVLPDRFRLTVRHNGAAETAVVIGRTMYVREPTAWRRLLIYREPLSDGVLPMLKKALADQITEVVAVGADTLDGRATLRYELPIDVTGLQLAGKTSVWLDAVTKLPVQIVFNGSWRGLAYHSIQRIEYDGGIQIDAPIP